MTTITTERCKCGHKSCQDVWLVGIGKFVQGSGFTQEEADRIIRGLVAIKVVERSEWDATRSGPPTGSGLGNGRDWDACGECGGINPDEKRRGANGDFTEDAFGHRSGCLVAAVLERPTVLSDGENGSLAL